MYLIAVPCIAGRRPDIAVVENQFDNVQKVLSAFGVRYKIIKLKDLEDPDVFSGYRAVFFPCGLGRPIETSITILSRGTSIQSVSLRQDYRETDEKKIRKNIKNYIYSGGLAYFSGFSFPLFNCEFGCLTFFDDFPFQGTAGPVVLTLSEDLEHFAQINSYTGNAPHSGWVAVKNVKGAEIFAGGTYETPKGTRIGPITFLIKKKKGELLYTSYHTEDPINPVTRFVVMRIVNRELLSSMESEAEKWDQEITTRITDTLLPWEHSRSYSLNLKKGRNTLYVKCVTGHFQLDICEKGKGILYSTQTWSREYHRNIKVSKSGTYLLHIYPAGAERLVPYAVVSGSGIRIFPYRRFIVLGILFIFGILTLYGIGRVLNPRKYSGRLR